MGKPPVNLKTIVGWCKYSKHRENGCFSLEKTCAKQGGKRTKKETKKRLFFSIFFLSNKWWPRTLKWNLRK
jgi:hypothetical protein